jgi:DNA-binding NarL/FixJ family response regulator
MQLHDIILIGMMILLFRRQKIADRLMKLITRSSYSYLLIVAFLDISMPAYEEKEIFSGEDLAKLILENMPHCKIILLTMYTELLKIKTIIRTIQPNGLIIKNDLTFDELLFAFDKVMKSDKYYSQSVQLKCSISLHIIR